jgi:hypothetical protein
LHGWFEPERTILVDVTKPAKEEPGGKAEGEGEEGKKRERKREIVPLDEFLKLDKLPYKMTALAMAKCAKMGVTYGSYEKASEAYWEDYGIRITDSQICEVTNYIGQKAYEEDKRRADAYEAIFAKGHKLKDFLDTLPDKPTRKGVFYIMIDGSMLNIRGMGWKEVKLALMFAGDDAKIQADGETIKITKKEYAVYPGSVEEFRKYLLETAYSNHCYEYEKIVIISDGAAWIRIMCEEMFPQAVQILDFYHLVENIYTFAKYRFGDNTEKVNAWAGARIDFMKAGRVQDTLACLEEIANVKCPDGVINPYTYINNNINRVNYSEYKAAGYYIGSGPIESSNKTVVQERLKRPGQRWDKDRCKHLLSLRRRIQSGHWQDVRDMSLRLTA